MQDQARSIDEEERLWSFPQRVFKIFGIDDCSELTTSHKVGFKMVYLKYTNDWHFLARFKIFSPPKCTRDEVHSLVMIAVASGQTVCRGSSRSRISNSNIHII